MIRGLSPDKVCESKALLESVHPECANLYSRVPSVTDQTHSGLVVQENRSESMQPMGLLTKRLVELGNAANSNTEKRNDTVVYG